ncbi:MAG: hypothetical protein CME06_14960 [Gemmatimonadetes bacterium]|nr:hypothetical protein [Gemmatimonadota bacterium]
MQMLLNTRATSESEMGVRHEGRQGRWIAVCLFLLVALCPSARGDRLWFVADVGLLDGAFPASDGVTFGVEVRTPNRPGHESILHMNIEEEGWHPVAVELSRWQGRPVMLRLVVSPGQRNSASYDFAAWGRARIVRVPDEWEGAGAAPSEDLVVDLVDTAHKATTGVGSRAAKLQPRRGIGGGAAFDAYRDAGGRTSGTENLSGGVKEPAIFHHPAHSRPAPSWGEWLLDLPAVHDISVAWLSNRPTGAEGSGAIFEIRSRSPWAGTSPIALRILDGDEEVDRLETELTLSPGEQTHEVHWAATGVAAGSYTFELDMGPMGQTTGPIFLDYSNRDTAELIELPPGGGVWFAFWMGLSDGAFPSSNGVEFQVSVRESRSDRGLAREVHRAVVREPGWTPVLVDLIDYQGREIVLTLTVDPLGRGNFDWAIWGEPKLIALPSAHPGGLLDPESPIWSGAQIIELLDLPPTATGIGPMEVDLQAPNKRNSGAVFHPRWGLERRQRGALHRSAGVGRAGIFHHPAYELRPKPSWAELSVDVPTIAPLHMHLELPGRDAYDRERFPITTVVVGKGVDRKARLDLRVHRVGEEEPVFNVVREIEVPVGSTRLALFWPTFDEPSGQYRIDVALDTEQESKQRLTANVRKRGGLAYLESAGEEALHFSIEAEKFVGGPWRRADLCETYFSGFGGNFMSGQRCLSLPAEETEGEARATIRVPRSARYRVWAHFEAPTGFETRFGIRIVQDGEVVFDERYGDGDALKLWSFGSRDDIEARLVSDPVWPWGGGDNVVWQGHDYEVGLDAGTAEIILYGRDNGPMAADRNVDAIFLTTRKGIAPENPWLPYLDELATAGRVFVRFRNPEDAPDAINISGQTMLHRNPFLKKPFGLRKATELRPGEQSQWIDLGRDLDTTDETTLRIWVDSNTPEISPKLEAEFCGSRGESPIERVDWTGDQKKRNTVLFNIPPRYPEDGRVTSGEQVLEELVSSVKAVRFRGRMPRRFLIYPNRWDEHTMTAMSSSMRSSMFDLYGHMGFNTLRHLMPEAGEASDPANKVRIRRKIHLNHANVSREREAGIEREVHIVSLGDEIPLPRLHNYLPNAAWQAEFRLYVEGLGLGAKDLLPLEELHGTAEERWQRVRMVGPAEAKQYPRLYYHTIRFQGRIFTMEQGRLSEQVRVHYGDDVLIGANFSPHNYFELPSRKWIEIFREGGMTMPWSEDYLWQVPEVSTQVVGYLGDFMWAGAREAKLPIAFYAMPHTPNNTDEDLRRSAMSAIGHGAKIVNYFCAFPKQFWYENYVDAANVSRYLTMGELNHEIGAAEAYLLDGYPRRASVGIVVPDASDIWENAGTGTYGDCDDCKSILFSEERKALWLALRHLQIPVEIVPSADVRSGAIADYSTLYIAGGHVARDVARGLIDWVREGGVLFASGGTGVRDEYDRPSNLLPDLIGCRSLDVEKSVGLVRAKVELPRLEALGRVRMAEAGSFDAVALRQRWSVKNAEVLGRFENGDPAIVIARHGRGSVVGAAALPGLAYVRSAIPIRPWDRGCRAVSMNHWLPSEFDRAARSVIAMPLQLAGVGSPARCSNPLVEPNLLEGPSRAALVLVNFTDSPIETLSIELDLGWTPSRIRSVRGTAIERRGRTLMLSLGVSDILMIDR